MRIDERNRVNAGTVGFADLAPAHGEVIVHADLGRQRQSGGEQQRRPVHRMEPQYALADQVYPTVGTDPPPFQDRASPALAGVAQTRHVVAESVPPDVDDLVRVAGYRYAPASRPRLRPRDGEVAQPGADEREHFVAARVRDHAQLARLDRGLDARRVTRQAEEPVRLGEV